MSGAAAADVVWEKGRSFRKLYSGKNMYMRLISKRWEYELTLLRGTFEGDKMFEVF